MKNRFKLYTTLFFIAVFVAVAVFIDLPNGPYLKIGDKVIFQKEIKIKQGLDLQGGARLTYSADLSKLESDRKSDAMNSVAKIIENRINAFGVAEPTVQIVKSGAEDRLVVEMPGIKDVDEANTLIGKTAELKFKELNAEGTDFVDTGLGGKDFKRADVSFDQAGKPQIDIEFTQEGGKKFEEITARNVGKPLAIYLDEELISSPTVNQQISGGRGVITGDFELKDAKNLAIQLNAGALPVPVKLIETRSVGATLGQESVNRSVYAGIVGIIFVVLFMIFYYRFFGIFSTIGLILYGLFTLAFMKVFGVTLTMGGIAGLILTVGMSVETDILVFERIREELRAGRRFEIAVKNGFQKTWPSLWDSNAVTLIIAALLYTVGGTVRGFALVLAIGIFIGLFTTFTGTKTFFSIAIRYKIFQKYWLYGVRKQEVAE